LYGNDDCRGHIAEAKGPILIMNLFLAGKYPDTEVLQNGIGIGMVL